MWPTAAGTSTVGFQTEMPSISSGRLPCTVTPTGRVCGTGIGMEWIQAARLTSSSSTMPTTARANRSHCRSGSKPASSRKGLPSPSISRYRARRGRLVVLQVVLDEADLRAAGAVVDQLVGVELGDQLGVEGVEQFRGDLPDDVAGIGETGEAHQQVQPAQFGAAEQRVITDVERFGVQQGAGNPFHHGMFLSQ